MKFIVTEDYEVMSRTAARVISGYVSSHPDCVLGLATGSTPIGLYRCLVEDYEAGALSFKDVTSFNLDEYRGLDPQHDQSYRYFMEHNLFSHVDIRHIMHTGTIVVGDTVHDRHVDRRHREIGRAHV